MKRSMFSTLMLTVLAAGILSSSAWATAYNQGYQCSSNRLNLWDREWCEKDWTDTNTWGATPGHPDDTGDTANIGGNNSKVDRGEWMRMNISTKTIGDLKLWIPAGTAGWLKYEFWGSGTITTTKFTIDATKGTIDFIAGKGAKLQTN